MISDMCRDPWGPKRGKRWGARGDETKWGVVVRWGNPYSGESASMKRDIIN